MAIEHVLVVDDEPLMRDFLEAVLRRSGYEVGVCADGLSAIEALQKRQYDVVLTDMKMPGLDGLEVLREVKTLACETDVVLMTAYGTVETAVSAMKLGAFDYILKPFTPDQIEHLIHMVEERRHLINENRYLRSVLKDSFEAKAMIGDDPATRAVKAMIQRVATSRASVLISGETGTGKEMVASAIHYHSPRKERPFVCVNCAALSETLLESELFGHEKGAFTGAMHKREGRFELANGGTLLLDEVSEISAPLQTKLLRVLQEREFERVGGNRTIKVDVRIIATTNRSLEEEIAKGTFREDLFYRLNVLPVRLSPLRQRPGDIPTLAEYFLGKYRHEMGRLGLTFGPGVMDVLCAYAWPGNVRELQNIIERVCVMSLSDEIAVEDLALNLKKNPEPFSTQRASQIKSVFPSRPTLEIFERSHEASQEAPHGIIPIHELEKQAIFQGLKKCGGNKSRTAQLLGITSRTLRNKLQEYGVSHESHESTV